MFSFLSQCLLQFGDVQRDGVAGAARVRAESRCSAFRTPIGTAFQPAARLTGRHRRHLALDLALAARFDLTSVR